MIAFSSLVSPSPIGINHLHAANGHQPQELVAPETNSTVIVMALATVIPFGRLGTPQRVVPR